MISLIKTRYVSNMEPGVCLCVVCKQWAVGIELRRGLYNRKMCTRSWLYVGPWTVAFVARGEP